jgi:hypothetical protein
MLLVKQVIQRHYFVFVSSYMLPDRLQSYHSYCRGQCWLPHKVREYLSFKIHTSIPDSTMVINSRNICLAENIARMSEER